MWGMGVKPFLWVLGTVLFAPGSGKDIQIILGWSQPQAHLPGAGAWTLRQPYPVLPLEQQGAQKRVCHLRPAELASAAQPLISWLTERDSSSHHSGCCCTNNMLFCRWQTPFHRDIQGDAHCPPPQLCTLGLLRSPQSGGSWLAFCQKGVTFQDHKSHNCPDLEGTPGAL